MSKFNLFIISLIIVSVGLFGTLVNNNNSSFNSVVSANLDIGSTAPTFTPTPTGIGSSAPTYTPTPTFTLTPTNTPIPTSTSSPTPTFTPTATPTETPTLTPTVTPSPTPMPHIATVDNADNSFSSVGKWKASTSGAGFVGTNWIHDMNNQKGQKSGRWTTVLPAGTYNVYTRYVNMSSNATNVPYTVNHLFGNTTTLVNQTINQGSWVFLGSYIFDGLPRYVEVRNTNTNGFVVADSVRFEQTF